MLNNLYKLRMRQLSLYVPKSYSISSVSLRTKLFVHPFSSMAASQQKKIGLIIGSTRNPRVGPSIAKLLHKVLVPKAEPRASLSVIDIADFNLPLFDESIIPARVTDPSQYGHEHTRVWSRGISQYDGFIFLTSQNNWDIPASLKNALDYLFNEWSAKHILIVSYGGHGGDKAASALTNICTGMKMLPMEDSVQLSLTAKEGMMPPAINEGVLIDDAEEVWKKDLDKLKELFGKLLEKVETSQERAPKQA